MEDDPSQNTSEQIVKQISEIRFLADFVFPNPQYYKASIRRELADLIVAVGTTLIIFQIKTHFAKPDSEYDTQRAMRKILEAYRQFRTLIEGFGDKKLKTLKNSHGIDVPFDPFSFKDIYLIALLDYVCDEDGARFKVFPKGFNEHNLPITFSAFVADDLFFLAHQFDTVRDFTTYLDVLSAIERKMPTLLEHKFSTLVAHFKLYPQEILDLIEYGTTPDHLNESIVDEYVQKGDGHEDASYFFDSVLSILHSSVGTQTVRLPETVTRKLRAPFNSNEAYWIGISALADTSRWQRQQIGTLLLRKIEEARTDGFAFGAVIFEDECRAILIHCTESSFEDCARELGGLALALIATHQVNSVTCLGVPIGSGHDGYAVVSLRREWIADIEALKRKVVRESLFSQARRVGV